MNNFSSIFYFYFLLENDCPVAIFVSVYVYVYLGMYMYVWYIRIFLLPRSPSSSAELSSGRPPFYCSGLLLLASWVCRLQKSDLSEVKSCEYEIFLLQY